MKTLDRRDFLKKATLASASALYGAQNETYIEW
ncbi:twin-arginine translocation signal domain-containing protein [Bacteroides xylanisolvens]|nr:twin-arginine translocation signal domain-containing protein [Bacteroides xylanisolvens]